MKEGSRAHEVELGLECLAAVKKRGFKVVERIKVICPFLTENPRLQLLYFPPACPQLNSQEYVWNAARQSVSHNHRFTTLPALRTAFATFLDQTFFNFVWLEHFVPHVFFHV